jgi:hypothetical protein
LPSACACGGVDAVGLGGVGLVGDVVGLADPVLLEGLVLGEVELLDGDGLDGAGLDGAVVTVGAVVVGRTCVGAVVVAGPPPPHPASSTATAAPVSAPRAVRRARTVHPCVRCRPSSRGRGGGGTRCPG